jgi:hypothetical protein
VSPRRIEAPAAAQRAAPARGRHRSVRRGRVRLPRAGHPVPRRAHRSEGRLVQYACRILRPYDGKATAEVHDYYDELTGVLASSLAKRAPGYTSLGFPDPRKHPYTSSADTTHRSMSRLRHRHDRQPLASDPDWL